MHLRFASLTIYLGKSLVASGLGEKMIGYVESVFMSWHHHENPSYLSGGPPVIYLGAPIKITGDSQLSYGGVTL